MEGESGSKEESLEEEPALTRRSGRERRPTKRYLERDSSVDEGSN